METLKQKGKNQNTIRTIILYVVLALIATFIIISFLPSTSDGEVKKLSEVLTLIEEDKVKEVKIDESTVNVELKDDTKIKATKELQEVVQFLKHPEKFRALGAKIPKGVLLVGPSGFGKTLLARAVAGEAEGPFYSIAGSGFMEMLVGGGVSRVRDLFENAK